MIFITLYDNMRSLPYWVILILYNITISQNHSDLRSGQRIPLPIDAYKTRLMKQSGIPET